MTVPKDHAASIWKLLARHALTGMRIAQDMYNADPTVSNHNLAFDRQRSNYLFLLDIALHSHHGRYRLQFGNHPQDREVACMNNQLNASNMPPRSFWQLRALRDLRVGDH